MKPSMLFFRNEAKYAILVEMFIIVSLPFLCQLQIHGLTLENKRVLGPRSLT